MTAKPSLFPSVGRLLVYTVLALATAFFLLPLYAMPVSYTHLTLPTTPYV